MGKGFKHGSSVGGGYELNFQVVHSKDTAPSNPSENTIWLPNNWVHNCCIFSHVMPLRRSKTKNFATYPYASTTNTSSGVTFTDNKNGTLTVNGTASKDVYFRGSKATAEEGMMLLPAGTYTVSGCPSGGSESTYMIQLITLNDSLNVASTINEFGSGTTFTLSEDTFCRLNFYVKSGAKISNQNVYFQVEAGSAKTAFAKGNAQGQVWIKPDFAGSVSFEALKRNSKGNGIVLCPGDVYMFTESGGWEKEDGCKIYQNGAWKSLEDLTGYYFKDGNQCTDVTGGWTTSGWDNNGTATVGSTIVLSGDANEFARIGTANAVDLTNVNKIWFTSPNGTNGKVYTGYLGVSLTKSGAASFAMSVAISSAGTGSLDVSGLTGEYYISMYVTGTGPTYLDFSAIWTE